MPDKERFNYLFEKYFSKTSTSSEEAELFRLFSDPEYKALMNERISERFDSDFPESVQYPEKTESIFNRIIESDLVQTEKNTVTGIFNWKRMIAAAAVFAGIIATVFYLVSHQRQEIEQLSAKSDPAVKEITAPVSTQAVITLANGQQIALDTAGTGALMTIGSLKIMKHADGSISYEGINADESVVQINTINVPRRSKVVEMLLNDGTKVWLNAESSLKYPTAFPGAERIVEISGEAYFEVAKLPGKNFKVVSGGTVTEVLGTHFNVNTYKDDADLKVTLLEGKVKVTNMQSSGILQPGEQAVVNISGSVQIRKGVDTEEVMSWKNGFFYFNGTGIESIMNQIKRWYDVEVIYEGDVKTEVFNGTIPRTAEVSKLLEKLELTKTIKFDIDGKKILVKPYQ